MMDHVHDTLYCDDVTNTHLYISLSESHRTLIMERIFPFYFILFTRNKNIIMILKPANNNDNIECNFVFFLENK